jgi:hypothetical protein
VVFEFGYSRRVVLECPIEGNATYILSGNWKKQVGHSKLYLRTNAASSVRESFTAVIGSSGSRKPFDAR